MQTHTNSSYEKQKLLLILYVPKVGPGWTGTLDPESPGAADMNLDGTDFRSFALYK